MAGQQLGELGPYTLLRQIAVGGMAEIYLAKTRGVAGFEKFLCLKIIHPNYADDEHFIEMLIDEAKICVGLNHANIVQIFDLGRDGKTYFIAMEFIDGADLFKVMRRLSEHDIDVPIDAAAYVAHEICTGLDYAHRKRDDQGRPLSIIHRDISPQNILISTSGEVKIVDFGIAKAASRSRKTQAGVIKGKYYYMSPEQAWGDPVDQRSDIFSAGIILYEVLTGQMLYLEEDMHRLLDMVRKADIARPTTKRRDIPPQLENVVLKALARRPADRWQTAHEFQVALTNFLFSHAPDFTPSRLADVLQLAISDEPAPPPRVRDTTRQVDVERLMSRVDYQPRTEHSVIFRVGDLLPQQLPSDEEDRGERTMITGPPAMMHGLHPVSNQEQTAVNWTGHEARADNDPTTVSVNPTLRPHDDLDPRPGGRSRPLPAEVVIQPQQVVASDPTLPSVTPDMTPTPMLEPASPMSSPAWPLVPTPLAPTTPPTLPQATTASRPPASPAVTLPPPTPAITLPWPPPATPPWALQTAPSLPPQPPPIPPPVPSRPQQPPQAPAWSQPGWPQPPPWPSAPDLSGQMPPLQLDEHMTPDTRRRHRRVVMAALVGLFGLAAVAAVFLVLFPMSETGGTLEVISVPEGAEVRFNGQPLQQPTPLVIPVTDLSKTYQVEVVRQNYQPWRRSLTLSTDDNRVRVLAVLTPIYGRLHITSTPTNADIYISGEHRGKTPATIENLLPTEDVNLELRKRKYRPATRTLKWGNQTYLTEEITLHPSR